MGTVRVVSIRSIRIKRVGMQIISRECPKCGKIKPISEYVWRKTRGDNYGNCRSCRKITSQITAPLPSNDPRVWLLNRSILNAHTSGIEHRLTIADIPLPNKCKYLGVQLIYPTDPGRDRRWSNNQASIDRIDSKKGYTPDNIQVISFLANRMKQDATIEEMVAFARGVLKVHG